MVFFVVVLKLKYSMCIYLLKIFCLPLHIIIRLSCYKNFRWETGIVQTFVIMFYIQINKQIVHCEGNCNVM